MKILQINTVYNSGSIGHIVADIKQYVEKENDQCLVAYGRGKSDNQYTYNVSGKIDLYVHALLTRITDKTALYSSRNTRKLIGVIQKFRPDIIHLHNLHGYYLNYKLLFDFLKQYKKPVVWTLHDCWAFTGHCVYFDRIQCNKWKIQCKNCPEKKEYPASFFRDGSYENYIIKRKTFNGLENMWLVTPSDWLKGKVYQSFLKAYPVKKIYNGVDLSTFKIRNAKLRKDCLGKKIVLGVSNVWDSRKGLETFYELSDILSDSYQIIMIGLNKKQLKNVPSNIIALERTDNIEELANYYSFADVYFNSSVEETMGMTTIEALACGTPVLVYNRTALPEVVDSQVGKVIESGNLLLVKQGIEEICNRNIDPEKCRDYATMFSKEKMCEQYYQLYCKIKEWL